MQAAAEAPRGVHTACFFGGHTALLLGSTSNDGCAGRSCRLGRGQHTASQCSCVLPCRRCGLHVSDMPQQVCSAAVHPARP